MKTMYKIVFEYIDGHKIAKRIPIRCSEHKCPRAFPIVARIDRDKEYLNNKFNIEQLVDIVENNYDHDNLV